jgi:hypothetical protein
MPLRSVAPCSLVDTYVREENADSILLFSEDRGIRFLRNVGRTKQFGIKAKLEICSSGRTLGGTLDCPDQGLLWFSSVLQTSDGIVPRLGNDYFLPNPVQFIIILHPTKTKLSSVALVRERTIPIERPPLVGEVSASFGG